MKKALKWIAVVFCLVLIGVIGYAVNFVRSNGPVGTGFAAKNLCSAVFVSGRDPAVVINEDLAFLASYKVSAEVDRDEGSATASIYGFAKRKAVYRPGLGCALAPMGAGGTIERGPAPKPALAPEEFDLIPWPRGELVSGDLPPGVDKAKLDLAMDWAFAEPDPQRLIRTRAVVVVYQGAIIAERYAEGYGKYTPLIGWSMTKAVTNALVGILVKQGKLDVSQPAPVPEWSDPTDPRNRITLDQLLRMSSGLQFQEEYEETPLSDCNVMLFIEPDAAAFAANKPLEAAPDEKWSYSSGTTNIISRVVRQTVPGGLLDYHNFPRRELFDRIGMNSAILETDPSGTFVGSSFMYATARDWARFGLLYLNDGVWLGERVLPEGWVEYSTTPTPNTLPGKRGYGAQFHLNSGGAWMPSLPGDVYAMLGYDGQSVTVLPSSGLVVVRLGLTPDNSGGWGHETFLNKVINALPKR